MKPSERNKPIQRQEEFVDYTRVPMESMLGLGQICGQVQIISRLKTYGDLYQRKHEIPEHILITGPDGMGKRTIARAFAKTYSGILRESESSDLRRKADITSILTSLDAGDAFVLLNLQELKEQASSVLIPALDQFQVELIIGQGPGARVHPFKLSRFTLVAVAPNESGINPGLLKCFSLRLAIQMYTFDELEHLVLLLASESGLTLTSEVTAQITQVCEGSPNRIARLLRRFARLGKKEITIQESSEMLSAFGIGASVADTSGHPANLDSLSGMEFERVVTTLLAKMGFRAEMTKASGDGGIDIIANLEKPLVGGRYLIQCKRFDAATQIGAPLIREFYGALVADRHAVKGIFVTTSGFTTQARDFARTLPLELIDGPQLKTLLEQYI